MSDLENNNEKSSSTKELIKTLTFSSLAQNEEIKKLSELVQLLSLAKRGSIKVDIDQFDGSDYSKAEPWILHMRTIQTVKNIKEDSEFLNLLVANLRSPALLAYEIIKDKITSSDSFFAWLKETYCLVNPEVSYREELRRKRQVTSVINYAADFRQIVNQLRSMNELDKIFCFIEGLKLHVKQHTKVQDPRSLEEAIRVATIYDTHMGALSNPNPIPLQSQFHPRNRTSFNFSQSSFRGPRTPRSSFTNSHPSPSSSSHKPSFSANRPPSPSSFCQPNFQHSPPKPYHQPLAQPQSFGNYNFRPRTATNYAQVQHRYSNHNNNNNSNNNKKNNNDNNFKTPSHHSSSSLSNIEASETILCQLCQQKGHTANVCSNFLQKNQ